MCRLWALWGWMAISFGVGILVGMRLERGFFPICFGLGLICAGVCILRKK